MEAFAPGMGTPIPCGVSGERFGDGARAGAQGRKALLVIVILIAIVVVAQLVLVFILEVLVIQINGLLGIVPTLAHGCSLPGRGWHDAHRGVVGTLQPLRAGLREHVQRSPAHLRSPAMIWSKIAVAEAAEARSAEVRPGPSQRSTGVTPGPITVIR